jgi:hypothetical protein
MYKQAEFVLSKLATACGPMVEREILYKKSIPAGGLEEKAFKDSSFPGDKVSPPH